MRARSLLVTSALTLLLTVQPLKATPTSISSNFNGTNIADTSTIWFNSHITDASGATTPFTIFFTNQTITLTSPQTGIPYVLNVPDAQITIDPMLSASTVFSGGIWQTSVPNDSGNPFLAGFAWDVPTGENPRASNPVTWAGDFTASKPGISIDWQWSAAVYTNFPNPTDYNALGVTPIDGLGASQSGTPANFTGFVTGGARGGGGSNFTGSNSGTGHAETVGVVPEPGSAALVLSVGLLLFLKRSSLRRLSSPKLVSQKA